MPRPTLEDWRTAYRNAKLPTSCFAAKHGSQRVEATAWIYCNGEPVPGCPACWECAAQLLAEYERLPRKERWEAIDIVEHYAQQAFQKHEHGAEGGAA